MFKVVGPNLFWFIFVREGFKLESVKNLRIDPDRLWDTLMEMAKIGPELLAEIIDKH